VAAPICAAVLQTRHQQIANQRCTADRNCECIIWLGILPLAQDRGMALYCAPQKAAATPAFVAKSDGFVH